MKQYQAIVWMLLLLGMAACTPKNAVNEGNQKPTTFSQDNSEYKFYVSAYTSGIISATSAIRVRFATDIVSADKIGSDAPLDVLSFQPELQGTAIWEDRQTLRFTPSEWLKAGGFYKATVNIKKMYPNVSSKLATMDFDFKALHQRFDVDIRGLREQSLTDLENFKLMGTVNTTDAALPSQVEEMLSISQKGVSDFKVTWEHSTSSREHNFIIEGIKRNENGNNVKLSWDGTTIGVSKVIQNEEIKVPNSEFSILDTKVIREGNQEDPYIMVLFSLPLQQMQDLNGLVSLDNYNNRDYNGRSNFRYVIDGNELRVYPINSVEGFRTVRVSAGIRSINQAAITKPTEWSVSFERVKPNVRLVGSGVVIPSNSKGGLHFPFEATKLKAVKVEIFKVYENNVLRFLQQGSLDETYSMHYVGRIIAQKRVLLENLNPEPNENGWVRYGLDLASLVKEEEGAIYQVRLAFGKEDVMWSCEDDSGENELVATDSEPEKNSNGEIKSLYDNDYYYYNYDESLNPCHRAYYNNNRFSKRNVLGSNLGIIAKKGQNDELMVVVTDLTNTKPVTAATVELYDHVLQPIGKLTTNKDGIIKTKTDYPVEFIVVTSKKQKGYLRLRDGESLSLSTFETSGTRDYKGIKGKIYTERGVWRPGDSLFVTFVLEDKQNELPSDHPVSFELFDSRGTLQSKLTTNKHVHGMYDFRTATSSEAPTGYWSAKVRVGGASFYKDIRIETVKPNRLKIALDLGKDKLNSIDKNLSGDLSVKWLHGAPAGNVRTQIDVKLDARNTSFEGYDTYEFDDPAREERYSSPMTIYDAPVDKEGKARVGGVLSLPNPPSGFMRAGFTIKAYEKSGDISTDNFSMSYSPYSSYVGINSPKGEYDLSLDLNVNNDIQVVVLDEEGKPLKNKKVSIGVYKVKWDWWYDRSNEISNFNSSKHLGALHTAEVTTNSKGKATWKFAPQEWGRYMIRVADVASGHCSGRIFYAGSHWDDENFNDKQAATMLAFSADKDAYTIGEEVMLQIPAGNTGRALLTLENGFKVLEHKWININSKDGVQKVFFKTEKGMAPTIYAHIILLQPHEKAQNDLPIRSYGVLPIKVIDPKTKLEPVLDMADVLEPNSKVKIKVKENKAQAMTYTIAMVDEGLLDLTRFKTPDLWNHFYKKEALGVKTWDMYNHVLGAYDLDQILAIGGGAGEDEDGSKINRFKPVVRFIGPFHLPAGKTAEHILDMPNYVGSVRTMIVAAEAGAYGKSEKTTPVRKPLMVLGTLPRVLSPTEEVKLPVTIFAMEDHVKDVKITIETNDLLKVVGSKTKTVTFDKVGDVIVNFDLRVAEKLGAAKVRIIAESVKEEATYEVELEVRNPNPYSNKVYQLVLDGGKDWNVDIDPIGMNGTNEARLEISSIPPIDLAKRLDYLIRYPYGCIEQTTSSVFPQLYVSNLMKLDKTKKSEIEANVRAAIRRLQDFQTGLGGFAYWPGNTDNNDWGTNYAGHFLLEAQEKGYTIPKALLTNWKRYQKALAKNWRPRTFVDEPSTDGGRARRAYQQEALMQAYRLYTLALAKSADLGAMNKMRNAPQVPVKAKWRLAAAYAIIGKKEVARQMIKKLPKEVEPYTEYAYTYGSSLRDEAMILETLALLKERKEGTNLLMAMSKQLSSDQWYATQTVAYSLMAVAKFSGDQPLEDEVAFTYQIGANVKPKNASLKEAPIVQYNIDVEKAGNRKIIVKNKSKTTLFASVIISGQPKLEDTEATASNIGLKVAYQDMDGKELDPTNLKQGTNFVALVEVSHEGLAGNYDEMALHQVFPAGWEIINTRMNEAYDNSGSSRMEYQDVRDDRIYTYFDLPQGKTYKYKFYLNAAYQGKFYMPNVSCSTMYDNSIYANTAGKWVTVNDVDAEM